MATSSPARTLATRSSRPIHSSTNEAAAPSTTACHCGPSGAPTAIIATIATTSGAIARARQRTRIARSVETAAATKINADMATKMVANRGLGHAVVTTWRGPSSRPLTTDELVPSEAYATSTAEPAKTTAWTRALATRCERDISHPVATARTAGISRIGSKRVPTTRAPLSAKPTAKTSTARARTIRRPLVRPGVCTSSIVPTVRRTAQRRWPQLPGTPDRWSRRRHRPWRR